MKLKIMSLVMFLSFPAVAAPMEIAGIEMPEKIRAEGIHLVLNGAGIRTKTFLRIKIYAAGLYLLEKASNSEKIIASDKPMAVKMCFIYDGISPKKLIGTFTEGFESATGGNTAAIKKEMGHFFSFFTEEAKEGDVYDLVYVPGEGVRISMNGKLKGVVSGLPFKRALFAIWLGKDPADSDLKEGMLGE
ncbi:MAG: chalcone isomerase family protein [Candidatus Euphemobacter frigidus]|nr:chalcone isomerase family protein [Candidatus Euphemobacter frigidus]MDP8274953.1 chalcone isomerase family protein [Candidatus Euphemobacter frigidus]